MKIDIKFIKLCVTLTVNSNNFSFIKFDELLTFYSIVCMPLSIIDSIIHKIGNGKTSNHLHPVSKRKKVLKC